MVTTDQTHLAFSISRKSLRDRILIPKFYDPDLKEAARLASNDFDLIPLSELLAPGEQGSRLGDWVRRDWYGTGTIPYVRTSDLSHWRVRADYKKGVSEELYARMSQRQDVQPGDLLMVAHGTYLVGSVALVTGDEPQLILQDHVFRLRVSPSSPVDAHYLLAALSTKFVKRQIRARQFSADIIDKVGNRHLSVSVPVHRNRDRVEEISRGVKSIVEDQSVARRKLQQATGMALGMTRERAMSHFGFSVTREMLKRRVLIPKYYDPELEEQVRMAERESQSNWVPLGQLRTEGLLELNTGIEVGKMAYGTGDVPFIRTSDIADFEVKRDIRHSVSEDIYKESAVKASLAAEDVLLVRDGTYLVGSSAIVLTDDLPALICGGLFRLRSSDRAKLNPFGLLGSLNLPIVRKQMRARQFTRDVIDTLGDRIAEIRIPSPGSSLFDFLADAFEEAFRVKRTVKGRIDETIGRLEPPAPRTLEGRPSWSMR